MFTVVVTFLDEIDEYGYVRQVYEFENVCEARDFYEMKKSDYAYTDRVSVSADC